VDVDVGIGVDPTGGAQPPNTGGDVVRKDAPPTVPSLIGGVRG
jgi:hypothetical protein